MNSRLPFLVRWLMLTGITIFLLSNFLIRKPVNITMPELDKAMASGLVERFIFYPESLNVGVWIKDRETKKVYLARTRAVTAEHLDEIRRRAEEKNVPYVVAGPPNTFFQSLITITLYIALFCGFWYFIMLRQTGGGGKGPAGGGIFSFGTNRAKRFTKSKTEKDVTFADVAGCDEAKEELVEIVDFLKNPKEFTRLGSRIPKGVLLVGNPGTGKTLLAQAVAGESGVEFLSASGSEFVEMFVGVGASRIRSLFEDAKKAAPCIVFIDEIDAIGKKRGVAIGGGHDEREQALNQLLVELDGFVGNHQIVVIAATNRADVLDEALIRPGRFDRQVYVPIPDVVGREAILKIHARGVILSPEADLNLVAKDTTGMVGADLANVINEATLLATRRKKSAVGQIDLSDAVDKVTMGAVRSIKLSDKEKRLTAYHEAGHALMMLFNKDADPLHKITIIPRGQALGFTKPIPKDENHCLTKEELLAKVVVAVGGRAAEEIVFGTVTTGASSDFARATNILRKMVYELGMGEHFGLAVYKEKTGFFGEPSGIDASQKTKALLEKEVNEKLNEIYKKVKESLTENRDKLDKLANALIEKETMHVKEVKELLNI